MTRDILTALLINAAVFTLLFCIMLPVRALLSKRGSAVLQYTLWAVVIIKLLLPFGFESSLSPLRFLEAADTPAAASAVSAMDTQAALAGLSDGSIYPLDHADTQAASQTTAQSPYSQASAQQDAASAPEAAVSAAPILGWTDWALAAWVAGVLAAGGFMTIPALRLRCRIRGGMAVPSTRVLRILEECGKELGLRRSVRVLTQSALRVPVAAGFLRPVLLLADDIEFPQRCTAAPHRPARDDACEVRRSCRDCFDECAVRALLVQPVYVAVLFTRPQRYGGRM